MTRPIAAVQSPTRPTRRMADATASSLAVRGRDHPRGRALSAVGAARDERLAGAGRGRGDGGGPDAAGAGRVVVGDERPRRRRVALSATAWTAATTPTRLRAISRTACTAPARSSTPAPIEWSDTGWRGRRWEEIVIYELHVGTFSESGDFAGAISRLDDLVALGVTAIELMPIAQFPGRRNWGYDGVQFYAPSSAYGRPEDLKALVEACHARGLAILLDVVYNHFGPEGNYLHVHRARFLHRAASHAMGGGDQLRRRCEPPGARFHDRERALLARGVTILTGCASTRCTRSSTTATPTS